MCPRIHRATDRCDVTSRWRPGGPAVSPVWNAPASCHMVSQRHPGEKQGGVKSVVWQRCCTVDTKSCVTWPSGRLPVRCSKHVRWIKDGVSADCWRYAGIGRCHYLAGVVILILLQKRCMC